MQMHVIREPTSVKHLKSVRLMGLVVGGIFAARWKTFYVKKKTSIYTNLYNREIIRLHIIRSRSLDGLSY